MNRCVIFTDFDLDGVGSYLAFKWLTGITDEDVIPLKVSNLREKILSWLNHNTFESFDKVYFFDLDTTAIGDLIDKPNVRIFDHHETHTYEYKQAKAEILVTTSCTKLIYNRLKDKGNNLNNKQLELLALVDDYDSYTLKFEDSYKLNILFWYYNSNRLPYFAERFKDGFDGFTNPEKNLIKSYIRKFEKYYNDLRLYYAEIPIKDKTYKFISAFVDKHVNDVAHSILQKNKDKCDVVMMINSNNKRVYLRRQKESDLNLGKFAEKICDGGGHKYAAGGTLTETVKTLSKDFQPL
jgi:nanoRNase/pAp phosphatase (c-di-AMP/oligoRNAs hydrolase)